MSITLKCDDGDLLVSTTGAFILIDGMQKCAQDIAESLLNNWDPDISNWYNGSELYLIDEDPATLSLVSAEERIRFSVEESILRLQDLQEADDYADEDEIIDEIRTLMVQRVGFMTFGFYLGVVTASEEFVPQNFFINLAQQLPSTFDEAEVLSELLSAKNAQNAPFA